MAGRHFTERPQSGWTEGTAPIRAACTVFTVRPWAGAAGAEGACVAGWGGSRPPRLWGGRAWAKAGLMGGTRVPSSSACPALGPLESLCPAVRGWSLGRAAGGEAGALVHHRAGRGGPLDRQWSFWLTGPGSQALSPWPRGRCRRSQAGWVGEVDSRSLNSGAAQ